MRKRIGYFLVIVSVCAFGLFGCNQYQSDSAKDDEIITKPQKETTDETTAAEVVSELDPVLHKAVCEALGYAEGIALTEEDYLYVTNITMFNEDINTIDGISKLQNLEYLYISGGNITDISEVAKLEKLTVLGINSCLVREIPDLSNCTQLTEVHFSGNLIEDISSLGEIPMLEFVNLSDNRISSLEPLKDNTSITSLAIENNCILDYYIIADNESLITAIDNGSQATFANCLETEEMAKNIVETFPKNLSELELEKYIYQYVIDNMEFEIVQRDTSAFAYHPLKYGVGVCGDYAEMFCLLANHAGLNAMVCISENHAWNIVELDGVQYHCDTLWDEGMEEWIHFNLAPEEMGQISDHSFDARRY